MFDVIEDNPDDRVGRDRGYVNHKIVAYVDGVEAGYIKIGHVQQELVEKIFPTVWHYVYEMLGWRSANPDDDLRKFWIGARSHAGYWPQEPEGEVSEKEMLADLRKIDKRFGHTKAFNQWKRSAVEKPFVDYIRVANCSRKPPIDFQPIASYPG